MTERLRTTLLASALVVVWVAGAAAQGSPQPILDGMAQSYREMKTLRADLSQVKSYPQLGLTDPAERGRFYVKRRSGNDTRVRIEIAEPERRIVTVGEGRYMLYQPKIKQAIEGTVTSGAGGGASFVRYFFGDLSQARADYDIVLLGQETIRERETAHLRLTAKPLGKAYYRRIDLWVDAQLGFPLRQELVEPNESVIRLDFDDVRVNIDLDDRLFHIELPPDVERVRG